MSDLAEPGTFAGNDAIVAFARSQQVKVVIHQLNAPLWEVIIHLFGSYLIFILTLTQVLFSLICGIYCMLMQTVSYKKYK